MMKKIVLLFALVLCVSMVWGQVISQYIETNSGTTPKGIEIWNNTGSMLDFSTNNLVIEKGVNGGTPSVDYTLSSGTLSSDNVIVIGTSDLQTTTENNGSTFYEQSFTFNGDDALVVKYGVTITDVLGNPGSDPGSDWSGNGVSTANQNIQLKSGITTGDTDGWTDPSERFETVSSDPSNDQTGFGIAPVGGTIPPSIFNITHTPETVTSSDAVTISAEVTEGDAAISYVELHWGLASGDLTNTISMSTTGKALYISDDPITAQADGVTVYFEIYAEDIDGESSTTSEQSYTVNDPASLPYSESFDNSTWPTGWTYSGFTLEDTNNAGGESYEAELGFWNASPGISHITSPAINTTGETELSLFWKQNLDYYDSGTGADPVIELLTSTDGTNFTSVWTQTVSADETVEKEITLASSEGIGSGTLYIKWFLNSDPDGMLSRWRIDDIYFAGDSPTVIENITNTPDSPNSSETVSVSANITDDDGINTVTLNWGTSTGNLPNSINMSSTGKTVYTTDSDIPAHADGTTIYYEVSVVDVNDNTTVSAEQSYYVSDSVGPNAGDLVISEVCGDAAQPGGDNGFVEIFNNSSNIINLSNVQVRYYNSNPGSPSYTLNLSGVINPYSYIVVTQDNTAFNTEYGFDADFYHGSFYFNGGDDGVDIYDSSSKALILDSFNDNGTGASPWTWDDNYDYERTSLSSGGNETSWTQLATTGTPGAENDNSLPVVLSEFTAVFAGNTPTIYWTTQSETNNSGWNLYRNQVEDFANATCINVELIEGAGTTSEPTNYSYSDLYPITAGETYWYWLESVENNGTTETYGPITLDIPAGSDTPELPQLTSLKGNYPNPFNPQTTIEFTVKEGNTGTLTIYNAKGQVLQSVNVDASMQEYTWDAANYGSGVYFYKLETENYSQIKKMIMLK